MEIIIKNQKQIDGIRKSCRVAAATLKFIEPFVVPGVTTEHLDKLMEEFIISNGATSATLGYQGFHKGQPNYPKNSCISVNEEVCHGVPDNYMLKEGDIVGVDIATILNGYYGDTATTLPIGEISDEAQYLLRVAKHCLDIGIKQVAPGNKTGLIGHVIYQHAMLQGCSIVENYCGHGVGFFFSRASSNFTRCKKD